MSIFDRIKNGWNAFMNKDPTKIENYKSFGGFNSYRPDRPLLSTYSGRSIMTPVINRIAIDVSQITIKHVRLDEEGRFAETIEDSLNDVLTFSANIDQSGSDFIQQIVMSMFDEGVVAVVPIDCRGNPLQSESYNILTARVGKIINWFPRHVTVRVYNDNTGDYQDLTYPKSIVCIINNPFYYLMNAPNSTLQRLLKKLTLLDALDERNGAGKLDLLIQLPYTLRNEQKREQAKLRKKDLEDQLYNSQYGIGYIDGTERVIQLNRPAENTLIDQINKLQIDFFNQLGMSQAIFDGSATEEQLIIYERRTLTPTVDAIVNEMRRKWISKTARTQGQTIASIKDPFKFMSASQIAEAADRFTRNEIASSNDIRSIIGLKLVDTPEANELRNKNLNRSTPEEPTVNITEEEIE